MSSIRSNPTPQSEAQAAAGDIAIGVAAKGYCVFGTALSPEDIADLKEPSGRAVTLSVCDITDEAAVKSCTLEVAARTERALDLLISNAGILTPVPREILPPNAKPLLDRMDRTSKLEQFKNSL